MVEEGGARGDLWEAAKCVIYTPLIVLSQIILCFKIFAPWLLCTMHRWDILVLVLDILGT